MRRAPVLHRDDPARAPLVGHVKVTRADWLAMARDVLVTHGVGEVKILALSRRMGVSRSSFYGYFQGRSDLLAALLTDWEARNTALIVQHCARPAVNITAAVCNFFRCFVPMDSFDQGLDFAVREWARRDTSIRQRIDLADATRIDAITGMFARYGYGKTDADARARILYFMQLGYHALEVREPLALRLSRLEPYIEGFTGQPPDPVVLAAYRAEITALRLE